MPQTGLRRGESSTAEQRVGARVAVELRSVVR